MRVAIGGAPKAGKSTLALQLGSRVMSTDDGIDPDNWFRAGERAASWLDEPGPWVIEGVAVCRALRRWLNRNPEGRPCDELLLLWSSFLPLSKGQSVLGRGTRTIFRGIRPELERRGVRIRELTGGRS